VIANLMRYQVMWMSGWLADLAALAATHIAG
jgi:hypothetical protein